MFARCPDTYQTLNPGDTLSRTGRELLPGWTESVTHCVAMAGARASGKSLYMAVLIKQLELLARQRFQHVVVTPADSSTKQRYSEKYERPLYQEMKHMPPTPTSANVDAYQREPFIFNLGEWPAPDGVMRKNYLVIRDVAGEDLENPTVDPASMEFFQHADLVIMLFDPLKVPAIATYLAGLIPIQSGLGGNPEDVFRNLMRLLGSQRPQLALAVSKFDTLQTLDRLSDSNWKHIMGNLGAAFRRDNGFDYDPLSQQVLHLEVGSLLRLMDARSLINMVESEYRDAPYQYFAVSALGEAPRGENLSRKGIAPYRCLDPLLWYLSNHGVFVRSE
ncbi:hypothetical protein P4N68_03590 [Corynebacterium felinum]|uniref:Uncharacterized protein n=1 Tax=Corynebacterium felinum TaxID=131318 RepID=A0ABU2B5M5_9CORY|nr:hypothetical protein [Corynebacterium felinum]MDF5820166.1 hypothetical protein [Corynebacterium felinum]MDR7353918.1 hypothetical protein [Corynebacterium felinum]WJY96091.1 hypothetical protein CFELI_12555 [Corynebacterium felinum]